MSFLSNIFGGGGGGGGAQQTNSNVYQTNIPQYAQGYVENMLNATQAQLFNVDPDTGKIGEFNKYQPYTGMNQQDLQNAQQAVAGFSPLQQQAQSAAANMQMPGQYQAGSNLAGIAGYGALGTTGQAADYGQAGAGYGQVGQMYGAQGAQQANQAAQQASRQADMYGRQSAMTGMGGLGYGAQGAGYGAQGSMQGMQGANIGASLGQQSTNPNAVQSFMNPYLQASLDPQLREIQRGYDIQGTQQQANATRSGAFGGSREALMNAENQRNAGTARNQAIGQGYNAAYSNAQNQMNAANQAALAGNAQAMQGSGMGIQGAQAGMQGINTALQGIQGAQAGVNQRIQAGQLGLQGTAQGMQGAGYGLQGAQTGLQGVNAQQAGYSQAGAAGANLANIGQGQLAAQQSIANLQNQYGGQQQANQQQVINQGIQNYATAQQYPLMQLGTMSNMLRGLPMQSSSTQQYQAAPSPYSQAVGAAGTAATLASLSKKEGGEVRSYARGGIASYSDGEIVESVKNDLYDMDEKELQDYIKKSSSPMAKQLAQKVMAQKKMGMATGGIIAFADGEEVKENPAAVQQAYIDAAKINAANQAETLSVTQPAPASAAPVSSNRFAAMGMPTSRFANDNTDASPVRTAADVRSGRQKTPPTLGTAQAARLGATATPSLEDQYAAYQNAPNVLNRQDIIKTQNAPPPPAPAPDAAPVVKQVKEAKANDTLDKIEKSSFNTVISKHQDFLNELKETMKPVDQKLEMDKYLTNKKDYVGESTYKEDKAAQEERRKQVIDTFTTKNKLAMANAFATMATTPGSFTTAALTGVKAALPQVISNIDVRDKAMDHINDAIANLKRSDRLEKAGDFEGAYKSKQEAVKNQQEMQKVYLESLTRINVANIGLEGHRESAAGARDAAAIRAKSEERGFNLAKATTALQRVRELNKDIRVSKTYVEAQRLLNTFGDKKEKDLGEMKDRVEAARKYITDTEAKLNKDENDAGRYVDILTSDKFKENQQVNKDKVIDFKDFNKPKG